MAAPPVPTDVFQSYNGVSFPSSTRSRLKISQVASSDNRTSKCTQIVINMSGYLTQTEADAMAGATPGLPLDNLMVYIRRRLQPRGKALKWVGKGIGPLNVNSFSTIVLSDSTVVPAIRDVQYGPICEFTWSSLGGAPHGCHGALFSCTITTWVAECANFTIAAGVFLDVSSEVDYDVDEAGLVTIVTHGKAQIPMSLRPDNTIERTVADELEKIVNPPPVGFLRRWNRRISADRATCEFTITDRQMEIPPPNDIVSVEMNYRLRQDRPFSPRWLGNFSGTFRVDPLAPKIRAWEAFWNIVAQRIAFIRAQIGGQVQQVPPQLNFLFGATFGQRAPTVIPGIAEFDENLFKNETRISFSFQMIGAPLEGIAVASGLWRPIINANPPMGIPWDHQSWSQSLSDSAQALYGYLGANFDRAGDVIIDICGGAGAAVNSPGLAAPPTEDKPPEVFLQIAEEEGEVELPEAVDRTGAQRSLAPGGDDPLVPPEASWVRWECEADTLEDDHVVRHKPLTGEVRYKSDVKKSNIFGSIDQFMADDSTPAPDWEADAADILQQISGPTMVIRLTGFGVRLNYRVNPPVLKSYGNQTPVRLRQWRREKTMGVGVGMVLCRTQWISDWAVPTAPSSVPLPGNPETGLDGTEG